VTLQIFQQDDPGLGKAMHFHQHCSVIVTFIPIVGVKPT
jgi:hypothetical protein